MITDAIREDYQPVEQSERTQETAPSNLDLVFRVTKATASIIKKYSYNTMISYMDFMSVSFVGRTISVTPEEKLEWLTGRFPEGTIYNETSKNLGVFSHEALIRTSSNQLRHLPGQLGTMGMYRLGSVARYTNYRIDRSLQHTAYLTNTKAAHIISNSYCIARSFCAKQLVGVDSLSKKLECLFFEICASFARNEGQTGGLDLTPILIQSLAGSVRDIEQVNKYIKEQESASKDEELVYAIQWYEDHHKLPRGIPSAEGLTTANLPERLDAALYHYADTLSEKVLERIGLDERLKGLFTNLIYDLEGRDLLKGLFSFLIAECLIKQVYDPYYLTLLLIFLTGKESADFETNGFGSGKMDKIINVGTEMMNAVLNQEGFRAVIDIFKDSGLKQSPGGAEGLQQKKKARSELEKIIKDILYKNLKSKDAQHQTGTIKGLRELLSQVPVFGYLIQGTHVATSALFQTLDTLISGNSFFINLFSTLLSKNECGRLAKCTTELLYHPAYRIICLKLLEDLQVGAENKTFLTERETATNIKTIATFVLNHYVMTGSVTDQVADLAPGPIINYLENRRKQPSEFWFKKVCKALTPTVKELTLYGRVLDHFHASGVQFDGIEKFCEMLVRACLDKVVKRASPDDLANCRNKCIDTLLSYDKEQLFRELASLSLDPELSPDWESL